jgi:hypothetical protein
MAEELVSGLSIQPNGIKCLLDPSQDGYNLNVVGSGLALIAFPDPAWKYGTVLAAAPCSPFSYDQNLFIACSLSLQPKSLQQPMVIPSFILKLGI